MKQLLHDELKQRDLSIAAIYRPEYHMLPPSGWINDPNGFCTLDNQYHLFYQYFPFGVTNELMYWGHSISNNLANWSYEGIALSPDKQYDAQGVFSGTAIERNGQLLLMYTGVSEDENGKSQQAQCMAYGIKTFLKYDANPVILPNQLPPGCRTEDFRDPKIWEENGVYYCLTIAADIKGFGKLLLFKSTNTVQWDFVSVALSGENMGLGSLWECPDYFKLGDVDVILISTVDASPNGAKFHGKFGAVWITGKLDLQEGVFHAEKWDQMDDGTDFYAPQTTIGLNGQRIMIAWQQSWERNIPSADLGHRWAGHMTLPRELELISGEVCQKPAIDLFQYVTETVVHKNVKITAQQSLDRVHGTSLHLRIGADLSQCSSMTVRLYKSESEETVLTIDKAEQRIVLDRSHAGFQISGAEMIPGASQRCISPITSSVAEWITLDIYLDRGSIEVFCEETRRCLTSRVFPEFLGEEITFEAIGEAAVSLETHKINMEHSGGR
jgi:beta-fructofuranosidase